MPIEHHGPRHDWFAWHPIETDSHGWKWMVTVRRYKCHLDIPGAPTFWCYEPKVKK